jgi:hypothetical protein
MNKLLCNATLLFLGGTLLISNAQKPKFTYEYMITSNSNDINDMLVMYDVKQDFIKTYDELVLALNEEHHRDTIINNLDKFIDSDLGKCEYLNEKIVITIGEGKGGTIEGYLKSNICDSEKTNYRIFIFDLLFGE